jgi:hypothetical protein
MTEALSSQEHASPEPSPAVGKLLLEVAQFYIVDQVDQLSGAGVCEIGEEPDKDSFKRHVMTLWQQHTKSSDMKQFEVDFAAIQEKLTSIEAADDIITAERAARAERRRAQPQEITFAREEPTASTADRVAMSGLSALFPVKR